MDNLKKSVEILKNLQIKNGGILATPLDGAYPYVYVRDAVVMTKAFNKMGLVKHSEKFYYFLKKFLNLKNYKEVFQRYNCNGLPCVTQKNENDNAGLLLNGIYSTYLQNKKIKFLKDMWEIIDDTCEIIFGSIKKGLVVTERSIHEFYDLEHGNEIWANCACCRGLMDASEMAKILGKKIESEKWARKADLLKINIKKYFLKRGIFIKNLRYPKTPDTSQLAPFYFEIFDSKIILKKTLSYLEKSLWHKEIGGFRRFKKFDICKHWHWYSGGSGSWLVLTLWIVRFYRWLGDKKNEERCIKWVEDILKKTKGRLPEHIATKKEYEEWKKNEIEFNRRIINETKKTEKHIKKRGSKKIVYWALPLGWSHAEYILTKVMK